MRIMTQLPIGSKLKIKETGKTVTLEEIRFYPTRYKTSDESGKIEYYKTFEIELIDEINQSENN